MHAFLLPHIQRREFSLKAIFVFLIFPQPHFSEIPNSRVPLQVNGPSSSQGLSEKDRREKKEEDINVISYTSSILIVTKNRDYFSDSH
jgi:hypothetical protein